MNDTQNKESNTLETLIEKESVEFDNFPSSKNEVCLIAFTSGTTGEPKMVAHFHRDLVLFCRAYPKTSLDIKETDIAVGTPPLAFTFGLGGLVLFPIYYGASAFLLEKASPEILMEVIHKYKVTMCFTSPTAWKNLIPLVPKYDISSLRKCVSAGEGLPHAVWQQWYEATNLKLIDGIGSTEMLHIFISSNEKTMKPGSIGKPVFGYEAKIIGENNEELKANELGRLAVRGVTGCKYLYDERQKKYVIDGWNVTGDVFKKDEEGYYYFVSRGDDMIVSSGYNIGAPEVESVLIMHPDILECAVTGVPDKERGFVVCAYIVLKDKQKASEDFAKAIQDWFKQKAAPYKYPRMIKFLDALPRNLSGKIQRFMLK